MSLYIYHFGPYQNRAESGSLDQGRVAITQASGHSSDDSNSPDDSPEGGVDTMTKVDEPKMYKVLILNDDYTPMDFVVMVLKRFFGKPEALAIEIMLNVHKNGAGIAGTFPLEIAEMKVMQVNQFSQNNKYPLKCTMEEG